MPSPSPPASGCHTLPQEALFLKLGDEAVRDCLLFRLKPLAPQLMGNQMNTAASHRAWEMTMAASRRGMSR